MHGHATRQRLVDQYRDGYAEVVAALEGATDADLDRRPAPGKWTSREIVHHLADSEMTSAIRLRRLIAEDNPVIVGYDQEQFARRAEVRPAHRRVARRLQGRTRDDGGDSGSADRSRVGAAGTHSEAGPYSVTMARDLRRARARPRRADPASESSVVGSG